MKFEQVERLIGSFMIVTFIVLKLTGTVDWSWWWIVVPIVLYM